MGHQDCVLLRIGCQAPDLLIVDQLDVENCATVVKYEFAYFPGIGGALQALLTPDPGIYGFPHLRFSQVIVSPGAIVTAAIFMTGVEDYRPCPVALKRVLIWTNIYMAAVFILNQVIGSNYLFIAHKPETACLIDALGPWPWYILSLEVNGAVMCLLLYAPFALADLRRKRLVAMG